MSSRRVTIEDLAKELKLSKSTVSRALSDIGYVAPATRERVLALAKQKGYVPDLNARSLRMGTSREVGLVVSSLEDPFYAQVATGFEKVARARGYNLILFVNQSKRHFEFDVAQSLIARGVSGVAITPVSLEGLNHLRAQIPHVVQLDRIFSKDVTTIAGDNVEGGKLATNCLLDAGHSRIAFLIDHTKWTTGSARLLGYQQALIERGIALDDELVFKLGESPAEIAVNTREFLISYRDLGVTAVFTANSVVGEVFYSSCLDNDVDVPGDVSFITYDELPWAALVRPAVTTVSQRALDMGNLAATALLDNLESKTKNPVVQSILVQPTLNRRSSVKET